MHTLIIEDEFRMLELLRMGLCEHGFTVVTASDGITGLETAYALYRPRDAEEYRAILGRLLEETVRMTSMVDKLLSCPEPTLAQPLRAISAGVSTCTPAAVSPSVSSRLTTC